MSIKHILSVEYTIKCSFLEIYREVVRDLLNASGRNLRVRETPQKGVWVEGIVIALECLVFVATDAVLVTFALPSI